MYFLTNKDLDQVDQYGNQCLKIYHFEFKSYLFLFRERENKLNCIGWEIVKFETLIFIAYT